MSERLHIAESSSPASLAATAAEAPPDVIVAGGGVVKEVQDAMLRRLLDAPVLSISGRAADPEGAFALLSEDDLATASYDVGSVRRIAQAVRRAAWCKALEQLSSADARARASGALTRRLRVLHVEDSAAAVVYVTQLLQRSGIEVVACPRSAEAVQLAKREALDAALLDSQLPDGTGVGAARALHEVAPSLPLIGLTSSSDDDTERDLLGAGAWACLEKREPLMPGLELAIRQSVRMALLWQELAASATGKRPDLMTLPGTLS